MKFAPLDTFSRLRTVSLVTRSVPVSPFWRLWMRRVSSRGFILGPVMRMLDMHARTAVLAAFATASMYTEAWLISSATVHDVSDRGVKESSRSARPAKGGLCKAGS